MREQYYQFDEEQAPAGSANAGPIQKLTIEDLKQIEAGINYDKSNRNASLAYEGGETGANVNHSYKIEQEIKQLEGVLAGDNVRTAEGSLKD